MRDRGKRVCVNGEELLLVRDGDSVRAYSGKCPHAGAPLHEGAICDGRIICPWHKAQFNVADGLLAVPPALSALSRYEVSIQADDVLVGARIPRLEQEPCNKPSMIFIAGAGAAGTAAAVSLREFGYAGRIVMAGCEAGPPYDRTALSKFVMAGEMKPDEVALLRPADFYARHHIGRVEETVISLDAGSLTAKLSNGSVFVFDAALVATGAIPIRPDISGADLPVHVLRSRADAVEILSGLPEARRAIILGAGTIGLEAACGLREQNIDVTVMAPEDIPFSHLFGDAIGQSIRTMHEQHGVGFCTGKRAARITKDAGSMAVLLETGESVQADLVLIGLGVRPVTNFITGLAREENGALRVDAGLCAGGAVYAAGDVALFPLQGMPEPVRIENWRLAQEQGRIAACNMIGGAARYQGVPFFWTYHYGKRFEYIGHAERWDEIFVVGDLAQQDFIALKCDHNHVAAVVACSRENVTAMLMEKMRAPLSRNDAFAIIERSKEAILF